jgi:hypothetical protein
MRYHSTAMAFDTSPEMAAIHNKLYRDAGISGRARIAAELSDMLRELAKAGARARHPEHSDEQIHAEVLAVFWLRRSGR